MLGHVLEEQEENSSSADCEAEITEITSEMFSGSGMDSGDDHMIIKEQNLNVEAIKP